MGLRSGGKLPPGDVRRSKRERREASGSARIIFNSREKAHTAAENREHIEIERERERERERDRERREAAQVYIEQKGLR